MKPPDETDGLPIDSTPDEFAARFAESVSSGEFELAWGLLRAQLDRISADLDKRAGKPLSKPSSVLYEYLWPEIDHDVSDQGVEFLRAIERAAAAWSTGEGEAREFGETMAARFAMEPRRWPNEVLEEAAVAVERVEDRLAALESANADLRRDVLRVVEMAKAGGKLTPGQMGIALLVRDPGRSVSSIARQLGCATSTLTRDKDFSYVLDLIKAGKAQPKAGAWDQRTERHEPSDEAR